METDEYDTLEQFDIDAFRTYEEFLDKFVTAEDRLYLEDEALARDVKELYAVNKGEIRSREDYDRLKRAEMAKRDQEDDLQGKDMFSDGKRFDSGSFLSYLQEREYDVKNGRKSTIIFVRYKDSSGKETSAYIDYRERLKTDNFLQIFNGEKDLVPRPTDLSYYNWTTQKDRSSDSTFFRVDAGEKERLSFRNNTDRKTINVDFEYLSSHPNLDVKRTPVDIRANKNKPETGTKKNKNKNETIPIEKETVGYQQIVIFDYEARMK
jgi:hypothetical protein